MTEKRLKKLVESLSRVKFLVAGDFCLDRYLRGVMVDISEEAAIPVISCVENIYSPGGAGNTAWNLTALGGQVEALTVLGKDFYGHILQKELAARRIGTRAVFFSERWKTPAYEKFYARSRYATTASYQQSLRVDTQNEAGLPVALKDALQRKLQEMLPRVDAIVVVDQARECGVISPDFSREVSRLGKKYRKLTVLDSRRRLIMGANFSLLVPNDYEVMAAAGLFPEKRVLPAEQQTRAIHQAARVVLKKTGAATVAVTRGPSGITLCQRSGYQHVPTIALSENIDITGAGDTVTAVMSAALASGATLLEAAQLANMAASVTIRKIGTTGTACPEEILSLWPDFQALYGR
ncbi:MAG TPA: PfkB family carbohydrate kinase [bacterium]|nr:PfkB family carbohydrate kinase [bacterium]